MANTPSTPSTQEHCLRILNGSGDTRVAWAPNDPASVEQAHMTFDQYVTGQGFAAFATIAHSDAPAERITTFDPQVEEIIIIPAMQGGS